MYRQTAAVTHRGKWGDLGNSRVIFQYENTRTANCQKGTAGSGDGNCNSTTVFPVSALKNYFANGELYTPLTIGGFRQMLTTGIEYRKEQLRDDNVAAWDASAATADTLAFYLENNISLSSKLILTPGVRLDHHEKFGNNWSPSLNATYELTPDWTLKGGIARVFKAPNVYQTNPGYRWSSMGNGCNGLGQCEILGNPDLKPEISVNKELGLAWNPNNGWSASIAYFRNDYSNKIGTDLTFLEFNPSNGLMTSNCSRLMSLGSAFLTLQASRDSETLNRLLDSRLAPAPACACFFRLTALVAERLPISR